MREAQLSQSARRARALKMNNRPVKTQRIKKAPMGWAQLGTPEPGLKVESLDDLSADSQEKLRRIAQEELLYRIRGGKPAAKLSQTFEEAAQDLGFEDKAERDVLLQVVFQRAMDRYRTPKGKPMSALRHSVFNVLMREDHTSPFEVSAHDPENWGRRSHNSFTKRITELGHLGSISEAVPVQYEPEDDDEHTNGVSFTYYYLTEEFKKQFIKDAVAWDAERGDDALLSSETHARVAAIEIPEAPEVSND